MYQVKQVLEHCRRVLIDWRHNFCEQVFQMVLIWTSSLCSIIPWKGKKTLKRIFLVTKLSFTMFKVYSEGCTISVHVIMDTPCNTQDNFFNLFILELSSLTISGYSWLGNFFPRFAVGLNELHQTRHFIEPCLIFMYWFLQSCPVKKWHLKEHLKNRVESFYVIF